MLSNISQKIQNIKFFIKNLIVDDRKVYFLKAMCYKVTIDIWEQIFKL